LFKKKEKKKKKKKKKYFTGTGDPSTAFCGKKM